MDAAAVQAKVLELTTSTLAELDRLQFSRPGLGPDSPEWRTKYCVLARAFLEKMIDLGGREIIERSAFDLSLNTADSCPNMRREQLLQIALRVANKSGLRYQQLITWLVKFREIGDPYYLKGVQDIELLVEGICRFRHTFIEMLEQDEVEIIQAVVAHLQLSRSSAEKCASDAVRYLIWVSDLGETIMRERSDRFRDCNLPLSRKFHECGIIELPLFRTAVESISQGYQDVLTSSARRPALSRDERWWKLHDGGMSYGQIRLMHQDETGEELSPSAVAKAIKRFEERKRL